MRQVHPKTNGYSNVERLAALEKRRAEAEARNRERAKRNVEEQLHLLKSRPGQSKRERMRLLGRPV